MANYPAQDLATQLTNGGGPYSLPLPNPPGGTVSIALAPTAPANVIAGPTRETDEVTPNQLINVLQTGGRPPMPYMGFSVNLQVARVQVVVRSKAEDFAGGEALARAVRQALHLATPAGYIDVLAQETEPNYLGIDERALHRWSMSFLMRWVA